MAGLGILRSPVLCASRRVHYTTFLDGEPRQGMFQNETTLETDDEPGLSKPQFLSVVKYKQTNG